MAKVRCVWLRAKKTSQSASAQSFELLDAEGSPAVVSGSELLALRHASSHDFISPWRASSGFDSSSAMSSARRMKA